MPGLPTTANRGVALQGRKKGEQRGSGLRRFKSWEHIDTHDPVEYFLASDASAVIEHTNRVIFLEDDDVVHIRVCACLQCVAGGVVVASNSALLAMQWKGGGAWIMLTLCSQGGNLSLHHLKHSESDKHLSPLREVQVRLHACKQALGLL